MGKKYHTPISQGYLEGHRIVSHCSPGYYPDDKSTNPREFPVYQALDILAGLPRVPDQKIFGFKFALSENEDQNLIRSS